MRKIHISKKEFAHLYATEPLSVILKKYDICLDRLYRILDECEIPRKRNRRENTTVILMD